jgi:hypothetical protein
MRSVFEGMHGSVPACGERLSEPVGVVASIADHRLDLGKRFKHQRRALVVAHLAFGERAAWSSGRPWCARYVGEQPFF